MWRRIAAVPPWPTCTLAVAACTRLVADFMAVLAHSNRSTSQLVSTYSSDPILTFGAARVWYASASRLDPHLRLTQHILPQLRKLLRQDVVVDWANGGGGGLVGRTLLLLAMDAMGAVVSSSRDDPDARQYAGEFHSVERFLKVLYGGDGTRERIVVSDRSRRDVRSRQSTTG